MKKKQNQITFGFCDVNTGQRVYPALTDLPDKLPPAQQLYTSDDNMYAAITCSPPIGQSTAIPKNQTSVSTPQPYTKSSHAEFVPGPILCVARDYSFILGYISSVSACIHTLIQTHSEGR